jgi:PAS domain S-box-containing protein
LITIDIISNYDFEGNTQWGDSMTSKSTYEELEQRLQNLEKELSGYKKGKKNHRIKQEYLEDILNNANMPIYLKDDKYKYIFINRQFESTAHLSFEQVEGKDDFAIFSEPVAQLFRSQDEEVVVRRTLVEFEETISLPDGEQTFITAKFPLFDKEGKIQAIGGVCTDITARKKAEEALLQAHNELERRVAERTDQLNQRTERLLETNIALNILLEKREEDKNELEEKMIFNLEKLVYPYLEKLRMRCRENFQQALLKIIKSNLDEITSSFTQNHKNYLANLTPTQILIADFIKQGHTTKEIAALLNLSPSTIACHRQEIRKRLSLTNKKTNLQTALTTNSK